MTAYRSLASWRGDGPFGAWLTRIAVRIALRRVGQRKSVVWLDPTGASDPGSADRGERAIGAASMAAGGQHDPAMLAIRAESEAGVRAAVSALPEPYREVVTLRFFGECSLDEIARQTGRPLGTVKTHLRRGLLRMRESVDPRGDA